jgi:membrane protease YdiL (CAAX protease family)
MKKFFWQGLLFELGLIPIGLAFAYLANLWPLPGHYTIQLDSLIWVAGGLVAPLLLGWFVTSRFGHSFPPIRRMAVRVEHAFGEILRSLSPWQILALSLAAGLGEEFLFRGVLHHWLGNYWTAALFGLVHAITPLYFALAALMSFYLGTIYEFSGQMIWVPIAIHAIYDAVALARYRGWSKEWNRRLAEARAQAASPPEQEA